MTTVLITGASGFIGSHCLRPLVSRGYEVHGVYSKRDPIPVEGITWHAADLLDSRVIRSLLETTRPTHLLHLAWHATPGSFVDALENFAWVEASLSLYRHFAANGGRRIVTSGSSYEYDWSFGYCSELVTPRVPDTVYGSCKKALDELVSTYAGAAELSNAWARVFFLYGPRENPNRLVSSVIRSLLAGEPALCSHGRQIRDYLHVEDVGEALVALLDSDVAGAVNIGSGQPVALKTIVQAIGDQLDRSELIELGALPPRPNDVPLVVADVRRLSDEVGWSPAIDLEEGLEHTIGWWRETEAST